MTREEIRLQVAISVIQGVLEAKHGIIGEIVPKVAVEESLRIANAFVEEWYRETKEQKPAESEEKFEAIDNAFRRGREVGFNEGFSEGAESIKHCADILDEQDKSIVRVMPQVPKSHWKPNKYTLSLVKKVANGEMLTAMEQMAMETFYNDLQKLL